MAGEVGVGKSMLISTLTNTLPGGATLAEPQRTSTPGEYTLPRRLGQAGGTAYAYAGTRARVMPTVCS